MTKILIIGANSFVGKRLAKYFSKEKKDDKNNKDEIIGTYHSQIGNTLKNVNIIKEKLDITKYQEVNIIIKKSNPDIIIITAAITSNNNSEEQLMKINRDGTKNIVNAVKKLEYQPLVVYFSTEQIFDDSKESYIEEDIPKPLNAYGKSKLAGEQLITDLDKYIILRCSVIFGLKKDDTDHDTFVTKVIESSEPLTIFNNIYRSPVFVDDIPIILDKLLKKSFIGIINISGTKKYSYEEISKKIKTKFNIKRNDNIEPCTNPTIHKKLILNNELLGKKINFEMTSLDAMLDQMIIQNKHLQK